MHAVLGHSLMRLPCLPRLCGRGILDCTSAGTLLIGPLGTNFSEIVIEIQTFSLRKMRLKMSSAKRQPFCLGLNMLMQRKI